MQRTIGCLQTMALLVAVAGTLCLLRLLWPVDLGTFLARWVAWVGHQLATEIVPWVAAGVGVVAWDTGRWLERRVRWMPRLAGTYVLDTPRPEQAPEPEVFPSSSRSDGVGRPAAEHENRSAGGADAAALLDDLLRTAIGRGASDLHVQPLRDSCRVALRAEGILEQVAEVSPDTHGRLLRRLKVMADLVVYQQEVAQDGRFSVQTPHGAVDIRVSVLPTRHGESAVLRLAQAALGLRHMAQLGMPDTVHRAWTSLLTQPEGLMVLTGPTGSGKTTTLYASLEHIHRERGQSVRIATIEDPVEVELPFLSQTQVQPARGLGFAEGLRAVLRQDPNVLMIGEIRDPETAAIAVQAGLTGHLILTTLHADSAAGVFNRLIDMGVEPFRVVSVVGAALGQRLVPGLCPNCRQEVAVTAAVAGRLARRGLEVAGRPVYRPAGCDACGHRGVQGRVALYELLQVTSRVRDTVLRKVPSQAIEEVAMGDGMVSLAQAALVAAQAGDIAWDDALRVIG